MHEKAKRKSLLLLSWEKVKLALAEVAADGKMP